MIAERLTEKHELYTYMEKKQSEKKKFCAEGRLNNDMSILLNAYILPDKSSPNENLNSKMSVLYLFPSL